MHGKYVSEINLAASAIKYSLAHSKKVVNMDNHITSSGSYSTFQNWLGRLAGEEPLPNELSFLAFDNEQKGQKNQHGFNIVIYHQWVKMFNESITDLNQKTEVTC